MNSFKSVREGPGMMISSTYTRTRMCDWFTWPHVVSRFFFICFLCFICFCVFNFVLVQCLKTRFFFRHEFFYSSIPDEFALATTAISVSLLFRPWFFLFKYVSYCILGVNELDYLFNFSVVT